jgi:DNA-nicking Smr family endonuclease
MKRERRPRRPSDGSDAGKASDDGRDDFARAMADVAPLPHDPRGERVRVTPHVSAPRAAAAAPKSSLHQQDSDETEAATFVAPGVDRRELRRLKRGDYAAADRLDLHGLMATEALGRVKQFLERSRHHHRCVCIVHGRGLHSEGNVAILKTRVRACLREHRAVLAYADAPRSDGGAGAVYVLLRK